MEALKTLDQLQRARGKGNARAPRHSAPCTMQHAPCRGTITDSYSYSLAVAATLLLQGICVADCTQATWTRLWQWGWVSKLHTCCKHFACNWLLIVRLTAAATSTSTTAADDVVDAAAAVDDDGQQCDFGSCKLS